VKGDAVLLHKVATSKGEPSSAGTIGANHTAFACWDPVETVRFYGEILGFPLIHAVPALGWGNDDNPDMVHFFFDIGNGDTLAFFYYFGWPRPEPVHQVLRQSSHIAVEVPDEASLMAYRDKLQAAGYKVMTVEHETIESIYADDPNGIFFELTRPLRDLTRLDADDARRTLDGLAAALETGGTSIQDVWRAKAQANSPIGGPAIHVVDQPEWSSAVDFARRSDLQTEQRDGYVVVHSDKPFEIRRMEAGLHLAVWFTLPAGGLEGRITQFDRDVLRVEA
jgi:catechol 2,3-dioxygenase-like lactoylglutathione lyase family enzyme